MAPITGTDRLADRAAPPARRARRRAKLTVLALILMTAALANIGLGAFGVSPAQVVAIMLDPLGITVPIAYTEQQANVLTAVRLPRAVMAAMVGVALGISGTVYQGIFRNPLASPSLLGVSSGARSALRWPSCSG